MKFGIVVLPGSNCDHDAFHVAKTVLGAETELLWHKDTDLKGSDCVIIPGGFAYGDYLRAGAIARFSPIMKDVRRFADEGWLAVAPHLFHRTGQAPAGLRAYLAQPHWLYVAAFVRDSRPVTSRIAAAKRVQEFTRANGITQITLTAEPAPNSGYCAWATAMP